MAEKKPICNYDGSLKELQSGDSLPGGSTDRNVDGGAASSVYTASQVINGGSASG